MAWMLAVGLWVGALFFLTRMMEAGHRADVEMERYYQEFHR